MIGFGISSNGKFMMSCSSKTDMIIWDLKGQQLERLDTYLMHTHTAKISPCGRFVVATGFSPDVKIMEVCFKKTGEYNQVTKAYELTGHTSGVYDVVFAVDTSHIATISKDGTWKIYHTRSELHVSYCPGYCYIDMAGYGLISLGKFLHLWLKIFNVKSYRIIGEIS